MGILKQIAVFIVGLMLVLAVFIGLNEISKEGIYYIPVFILSIIILLKF